MTTPIKYRISSTATKPVSDTVKGAPLTSLEIDGNFRSIKDSIELIQSAYLPAGYSAPVDYVAGVILSSAAQTVAYQGEVYAPKAAEVPFTTSGTFEVAKFVQIQSVASVDLTATDGAAKIGYDGGTVQDVLDGAKSLQEYAALRSYTGRATRIYITGMLVTAKPAGIAGSFQHDPTDMTSADNGGTIIVGVDGRRWKRERSSYVDAAMFGGDQNTTDPFVIINHMIQYVLPGGTVSTNGWTGVKTYDSTVYVNKPCNLVSSRAVSFKLKDQSTLFNNTNPKNYTIKISSSNCTVSGFTIDSNKQQNYILVDGIKYYLVEAVNPALGLTSDHYRYMAAPIHISPNPGEFLVNVTVSENTLTNCHVHGIGVDGNYLTTAFTDFTPISPVDYSGFTRKITVSENYISGGCRSGVYFIGGVIDSIAQNNKAENWGWAAFRTYFGTYNITIQNNSVIYNHNLDATLIEDSTNNMPFSAGCGFRVGHPTRAPGTCDTTRILNNSVYYLGSVRKSLINVSAFRVEPGSSNVFIKNNSIRVSDDCATSPSAADYTGAALVALYSTKNVFVCDNKFDCKESIGVLIFSSDTTLSVTDVLDISGNTISYKGTYAAGKSGRGVFATGDISPAGKWVISENKFFGFKDSSMVFYKTPNYYSITGNLFDDTDRDATYDSSIVHFGTASPFVYSGNTIRLSESATSPRATYCTSITNRGAVVDNTLVTSSTSTSDFVKNASSLSVIEGNHVIRNMNV